MIHIASWVFAAFLGAYIVALGLEVVARVRQERQARSAAKAITEAHQELSAVKVVPIPNPQNFARQSQSFDVSDLFGGGR